MNRMVKVTQKSKNGKKAFKDLYSYVKPYHKVFLFAIILSIISAILVIIGPNKIGEITNLIQKPFVDFKKTGVLSDIDLVSIGKIGIYLLIIYLLSFILSLAMNILLQRMTLKISKKMRDDLIKKVNNVPLSYYNENNYGDILSRFTNDVDTITQSLNNSLGSFVFAVCQFLGSIIMMCITSFVMAITVILSSVLGFLIMGIIMKNSQKYFKDRQESLGKLNGYIEEIYSGKNVIRCLGADNEVKENFNSYNGNVRKANFMSQFLSGMMPSIMTFIGNLGYVCVCIVGTILVLNKNYEFGIITSFIIYARLFTQPLQTFSQTMTQMQSCLASSERVFGFLEEKELEDESKKTVQITKPLGNIEISHLKFGYDEKIIIHDFSCSVKSGSKVAIVGPTGSGKTTLVNLLMRFYEVNSGSIKIDGVDTKDMKREEVHKLFSMVLQDTWLFDGTIKENLIFNCENISDENMIKTSKACGIHQFIESLPEGYNTKLTEATNLSQGQKQLFTIARAMIQNSPMLILDEATSNVDTRTEIVIQKAMDELTENRTSFVIAHRLSTIKNADLILVLKEGNIYEQGTHDSLLQKNGFYASLYNSQFDEKSNGSIDSLVNITNN